MALGDSYNNSASTLDKTFYSRLRFNNRNDKTSFSFSYWKSNLKCTISMDDGSGTNKFTELQSIHLSPRKAHTLYTGLVNSLEAIKSGKSNKKIVGVDTGITETRPTIIFILESTDTKDINISVRISKISPDGKYITPADFNFEIQDYNYYLEFQNVDVIDCTKKSYNNLEIEMFLNLLDNFYRSMDGSLAYSVMDIARYEYYSNLMQIADKLGISSSKGYNRSSSINTNSNNSYFNRNTGIASQEMQNRGRSNQRESIDDLIG